MPPGDLYIAAGFLSDHRNLLTAVGTVVVAVALATVIIYLVMAFVMYWFHRARHQVTALWRLHQMHHSAERHDVSGAFLFHPLEVCYIPIVSTLIIPAIRSPRSLQRFA